MSESSRAFGVMFAPDQPTAAAKLLRATEDLFPMHYLAFPGGCIHAENVGGDIDRVLNTRCVIGAFPWKFEGGEACPCRIIAFLDVPGLHVEELREELASSDSLSADSNRGTVT